MSVDFDVGGQQGTFSLEEVLLWIMDWYLSRNEWFEVLDMLMDLFLTNSFSFHKIVIEVNCGLM